MEKTQKSEQKTPQKLSEEAAEKKERLERLDPMTTQQVEHENTQMINDLYRLLKKYQGLRNLIRELKVSPFCGNKLNNLLHTPFNCSRNTAPQKCTQ